MWRSAYKNFKAFAELGLPERLELPDNQKAVFEAYGVARSTRAVRQTHQDSVHIKQDCLDVNLSRCSSKSKMSVCICFEVVYIVATRSIQKCSKSRKMRRV